MESREQFALVVGCGRVGAALAKTLVREGWQVTVMDEDEGALARLGEDWPGEFVIGHGLDIERLRRAGADRARCLVAATNGDNTNIVLAQAARLEFHVPRVAVRILDPARARVYQKRGFEVVCPTQYAVEHLRGWIVLDREEG